MFAVDALHHLELRVYRLLPLLFISKDSDQDEPPRLSGAAWGAPFDRREDVASVGGRARATEAHDFQSCNKILVSHYGILCKIHIYIYIYT